MEKLLHYVWGHKLFPLGELRTTDGQRVEVIDPGLPNPHAGPDFTAAKLKLNGVLWAGNIEIHDWASDWMKHGHDRDTAYNNVVLHVVGEADCTVTRQDGEKIPQLVMAVPEEVTRRYEELRQTDVRPRCYTILSDLPKLTVHSWLSALQVERFERKAKDIGSRLDQCGGHWEDVFFITLARNYGFGLNADAFEAWARLIPLRAVDKHRDNLFQVEAFFLGTAGFLEEERTGQDDYYICLRKEYRYLRQKFSLPEPMTASRWKLLRTRPGSFPHIRLAQLAYLYHRGEGLFSKTMETQTVDELRKLLATDVSAYWEEHFTFAKVSPRSKKQMSKSGLDLIIINTVVPFLYAYGRHRGEEYLCERATALLEELPAENNYIIRMWEGAGIAVTSAADSQALIQLQKEYCDRRDCLRCRFGYQYLKHRK